MPPIKLIDTPAHSASIAMDRCALRSRVRSGMCVMLLTSLGVGASPLAGCQALVGDDFTGYRPLEHDAGTASVVEHNAPPPIDDCQPTFIVSNGIRYPRTTDGELRLLSSEPGKPFDTDDDANCDASDPDHCVVAANRLQIPAGKRLGVVGTRPTGSRALVLLAAYDIEIDGELNVASGGAFVQGPGDHSRGTAMGPGGGGGNVEPGAGSECGASGGAPIDLSAGLVGGGDAGSSSACHAGGKGGGALQLVSLCGVVRLNHWIVASGGSAYASSSDCPNGYGGGAGGTVWIQAGAMTMARDGASQIDLTGGGGGGGACRDRDGAFLSAESTRAGFDQQYTPGPGFPCESGFTGGEGGGGGRDHNGPQLGAAPVSGAPGRGTAMCGGGGGARGRVVLEGGAADFGCAQVLSSGICTERRSPAD